MAYPRDGCGLELLSVLPIADSVKRYAMLTARPQRRSGLDDALKEYAGFGTTRAIQPTSHARITPSARRAAVPPRPRIDATEPTVQTTVRFPHSLLKRARVRAAVDEVTLQSLVIAGLDAELDRRDRRDDRRRSRTAGGSGAAR